MSTRSTLVAPLVHLRTLAPFRSLSPGQLATLALEADEVVYERGEWLIPPGEPVRALFLLVDGYARVTGLDGGASLDPWSLVGFPDLLAPEPAEVGVRAETDVVALRLETDTLRDVCERNFPILSALLTHLAERVSEVGASNLEVVTGAPTSPGPLPGDDMDRVAKMVALQRAPAFPLESMDALAELAERVDAVALDRGARLWEEGAAADGFWLVASGSVLVHSRTAGTLTLGPGAIPGFPETLAGRAHGHAAEAAEESTLLWIAIDPFMDILEDHFELAYSLLGWLAQHVAAHD